MRRKKKLQSGHSFLKSAGQNTQLVWHGLNNRENLQHFIKSPVQWGELDVRASEPDRHGHYYAKSGELILRHDSYRKTAAWPNEKPVSFSKALRLFKRHGRFAKIDFKQGGETLQQAIKIIREVGFSEDQLWLNGDVRVLGWSGVRQLKREFPGAILQCPIDLLFIPIRYTPSTALTLLQILRNFGINRFSIQFQYKKIEHVLQRLREWQFEYNLYNIITRQDFERAIALEPHSITSDFYIPEWGLYGKGSGYLGHFNY